MLRDQKHQAGFTIVELLIVVVIIAILATITVVSYTGISQRSHVSTAIADLSNVRKKLDIYKIDNNRFPTSAETSVWKQLVTEAAGTIQGSKNFVLCTSTDGAYYAVIAWAPLLRVTSPTTGGAMYFIDSETASPSTTPFGGQGSSGTVSAAACRQLKDNGSVGIWTFNL